MSERHNPLKVIRWKDKIDGILAGQTLGPIRANLDLTNVCNHSCPMCEPMEYRKQTIADKNFTLAREVAEEVLDDLHDMGCKSVTFSGGGEPTLHPHFGQILTHAKHLDFKTYVITHGGLISRWIIDLLCAADHIRVSLDASNEKEHRKMHGSQAGEFDKVITNLRDLVHMRVGAPHKPEIGIAYTLDDANSSGESLEAVCKLAEDIGVDYIHFRPVSDQNLTCATVDWPFLQTIIEALAERHKMVDIWALGKRGSDVFLQREFTKCYASLTLAVVGANGDVVACCDERSKIFGNVNENRFKDIWLSERHRRLSTKIVPKFCQRCLMCSFNKSVEENVVKNGSLVELF